MEMVRILGRSLGTMRILGRSLRPMRIPARYLDTMRTLGISLEMVRRLSISSLAEADTISRDSTGETVLTTLGEILER